MLTGLDLSEKQELLATIGSHRSKRKTTPPRVAELLDKARTFQPLDKIALDLELRDTSILHRFLSLLKLPPEIQGLVEFGQSKGFIPFSSAAEIVRVANDDDRKYLAKTALENSLKKSEVQAIIQRSVRAQVPIRHAVDEILKLRPVVERQYLFLGALGDSFTNHSEIDCQRMLRAALAEKIGGQNILSVSCKAHRYSFMITESAYRDISSELSHKNVDNFVNKIIKLGGKDPK